MVVACDVSYHRIMFNLILLTQAASHHSIYNYNYTP